MYNVHQDALHLPTTCDSKKFTDGNGRECTYVDVTASRNAEGRIHITLTNTSLKEDAEVTIDLNIDNKTQITGEILTSKDIHDYNKFESPETVKPVAFDAFKVKNGKLIVKMPAKSIIALAF